MNNRSSLESGDFRSRFIVIITLTVAVIVGVIFALFQLNRPRPDEAAKIKAVIAFHPLVYLAGPILGEDGVELLLPPGVGIHDYSPTPSDIAKVVNAEVFFILGPEPLPLEKLFFQGGDERQPTMISASKNISLIQITEEQEDRRDELGYDIHLWISPRQAALIVEHFQQTLSTLYPDNSLFYRARSAEFLARLRDLDQAFQQTLSNCKQNQIVVSHNAFSYLARDYNFEVWPLYGRGAETANISPARLIDFIEKIRNWRITHLFYTEDASLRIIETLTQELGIEALPLYTLETPPPNFQASPITSEIYITVMEENLHLLSQGMGCSIKG